MNFQDLQKIDNAKTLLDIAFRAARKKDKPRVVNTREKMIIVKTLEFDMIEAVSDKLIKFLENILKRYPQVDTLPPFYLELLKISLDYPKLKKSLGAVKWAKERVQGLHKTYLIKIKKSIKIEEIINIRKQFYGRVSSIMEQINPELLYLDESRKRLRRFPAIKTSVKTVALAGYPNVGKSSLLKKLTNASPEIKDYSFTTKKLNMGYFQVDGEKIQVIDTPGAFDRTLSEMNDIEKQAYLVIKYLADIVIFLIDPTETCNYKVTDQQSFLKRIQENHPNVIVVYSKTDLIQKGSDEIDKKQSDKIINDDDKSNKLKNKKVKVFNISTISNLGIELLITEIDKRIKKIISSELKEKDNLEKPDETTKHIDEKKV